MKPPAEKFMLITKDDERSGQVHQETLDMYTDELKEKRVADEKLTEKNWKKRGYGQQANDLSTCRTKPQPCTCASDWLV
jgi:hypothetical protein